jgi:hypothetical protein
MRRAIALAVLVLAACKGKTIEQGVRIEVTNKANVPGVVQLQATVSNLDRRETLLLPATPHPTALALPTAFSISVPSSRTGRVDIVILGLNSSGTPVANGSGFANLQASAFVNASVDLQPGAPSCCADASVGPEAGVEAGSDGLPRIDGAAVPDTLIGAGGTLGGNAGDASPSETGGGGGGGGGDGAAGSGGAGWTGRSDAGGAAGSGGTAGTGGTSAAGGAAGSGGLAASGGTTGTGDVTGTGGASGTGGAFGTGGASGTGGAAGLDWTWADWRMPNGQVDVTAGAPNLASYTDKLVGMVVDNITGLMWQQAVPAGTYDWAQAKAYCSTLALGGYSDWRLPTRIELVSLLDFGHSSPAIDTTYFPSTPPDAFWSSSPLAGSSSSAWFVDFNSGKSRENGVSNTGKVRCVR